MAMTLHFNFSEHHLALFGRHICNQHTKSHHIVNLHEFRTNCCRDKRKL